MYSEQLNLFDIFNVINSVLIPIGFLLLVVFFVNKDRVKKPALAPSNQNLEESREPLQNQSSIAAPVQSSQQKQSNSSKTTVIATEMVLEQLNSGVAISKDWLDVELHSETEESEKGSNSSNNEGNSSARSNA